MIHFYFFSPIEDIISNQLEKHYYLEVFNGSTEDYQLERKHNEKEVITWNHTTCMENFCDYGILEKYVQTN